MIQRGTGNLLRAPADALVNTVNCVGVMGKGIALQFKKAWPAMFQAYQRAAKAGDIQIGHMHVYETGQLVGPRLIINFPTKRHWRSPSRLEDIQAGLSDLIRVLREYDVRSVAIPPLGAGLGGLDWRDVRPLIVGALGGLAEEGGVDVWLWEPGSAPRPADRPVGTQRPKMTPARASILALMGSYGVLDHEVTHLEVQKLAYFLEQAGASLNLRFAPHAYGPYSDRLYHMLQRLEGHQLSGLVDRDPWAALTVRREALEEAMAYLRNDQGADALFRRVAALIDGFQTPYGLELLATAHWVARHDPQASSSPEACLTAIGRWPVNPQRKRRLMRLGHLSIAWSRLVDEGWLDVPAAAPAALPALTA